MWESPTIASLLARLVKMKTELAIEMKDIKAYEFISRLLIKKVSTRNCTRNDVKLRE